jgi:hypothetical protein
LRGFLREKYGQQKHRMAFAIAKTVVESREEYEDRESRPVVLHVATSYFKSDFDYRDLER